MIQKHRTRFKKEILAFILLVQGCQGGEESVIDVPSDRIMRKYEGMGKLFGKDLILFGNSSDREKITICPYLWQATLDVLQFMGIQDASLEKGLLEMAWYESPGIPLERFKVVATVFGGRVASEKVCVTVFSEKKNASGIWGAVPSSERLARQIEEKILLRARFIKSQLMRQ